MTAAGHVALVVAAAAWLAIWFLMRSVLRKSQVQSHGGSRWANRADACTLGRQASASKLHADGIVLGWFGRRLLQTPKEDNLLLFGVQRSGKTSTVVVPTLLGWQGSVIATSTKEELVRLTGAHRASRSPVYVFAPLERDTTRIDQLGLQSVTWNPLDDLAHTGDATELADILTAEGKRGNSSHWYLSAANLLTALMLVEGSRGGDLRSVQRRLNRTSVTEYLGLASSQTEEIVAELLVAFAHTPEREAGSIASTGRSCLALWTDDRVAAATSTTKARLRVSELLDGGSLYLVAPAEDAERCRPLFTALLQVILRQATERARTRGGVLAPRLLLALDEVANFARIPRLASYVSSGPGQGIQMLLCFHDLAQLEAAYGRENARTIWNNCRARLLLPGQGDLTTLEWFSRAIGNETRIYETSTDARGLTSHSEQRLGHPLASVDSLRQMSDAVLLYANAVPARLRTRRWDQVREWRQLIGAASREGSTQLRHHGQRRTHVHSTAD